MACKCVRGGILVTEQMAPPVLKVFNGLLSGEVVEFTAGEDHLVDIVGNNTREDVPMHVVLRSASPDIVAEVKEWLSSLVLWINVNYDSEDRKGVRVGSEIKLVVGVQKLDYFSENGAVNSVGRWCQ